MPDHFTCESQYELAYSRAIMTVIGGGLHGTAKGKRNPLLSW